MTRISRSQLNDGFRVGSGASQGEPVRQFYALAQVRWSAGERPLRADSTPSGSRSYARCPAGSRCSSAGRAPAIDDGACAGKAARGGEGKQVLAENQNSCQSEPVAPLHPKCAPPFPLSLPPAERRRVRRDQNSGLRRPSVSPAAAPARESPRKLLKGLETGSTLATRPRRAGVEAACGAPSPVCRRGRRRLQPRHCEPKAKQSRAAGLLLRPLDRHVALRAPRDDRAGAPVVRSCAAPPRAAHGRPQPDDFVAPRRVVRDIRRGRPAAVGSTRLRNRRWIGQRSGIRRSGRETWISASPTKSAR